MKKTIYLNLNLDNSNDELLYNFLESLGRDKKAVLFYLLKQAGCFSSPADSPPVIQMRKKEKEHPVRKQHQRRDFAEDESAGLLPSRPVQSQDKVSEQKGTPEQPRKEGSAPVVNYQQSSHSNANIQAERNYESRTEETGWERFFTQEQIAVIKTPEMSKILEEILQLNEFQQSKMAEFLNGSTDEFDIKEALSDAKFAH